MKKEARYGQTDEGDHMKHTIRVLLLLLVLAGCTGTQDVPPEPATDTTTAVSGIQDLLLTTQDLEQLGMTTNGSDCVPETYETSEFSPLAQYSMCTYAITDVDTEVIIELKRFTNLADLNGSYQYDSSHYFSAEGLLSENTYGDQSKFRVNNVNDYGGEFNPPGVYFYHLWITKDTYLIHITSKGESADAKADIADIGQLIMTKFG